MKLACNKTREGTQPNKRKFIIKYVSSTKNEHLTMHGRSKEENKGKRNGFVFN